MKVKLPPTFYKTVAEAAAQCLRGGRTPHHLCLPAEQYAEWEQLCAYDHADTRGQTFGERLYMGLKVHRAATDDITVSELPLQ